MAVAQSVCEVEATELRWLEIEDSEGKVWHYERRDIPREPVEEVHVRSTIIARAIQAYVARGEDGAALLRQEGPGLPTRIVVDSASGRTSGSTGGAYWSGLVEYELVPLDARGIDGGREVAT
jgi:hypothetical protein